jgi:hypothetical protein
VRQTKLILVEGIPGSGKSTTGQFLESRIAASGLPVTWWYEELKDHPLYIFDDETSYRAVIEDLHSGRFRRLADAALEKWRRFAEETSRGDSAVILDSCLFGYLTWSLFPEEAPVDLIMSYVGEVETIIRATAPCLIYLYQDDVPRTLTRLCEARGRRWADSFVESSTQSPYAIRRGLRGFAGLVAYWTEYQLFTERCFEAFGGARLKIEGSAGNWSRYQEQTVQFLGLSRNDVDQPSDDELRRFVGTYEPTAARTDRAPVQIRLENGDLYASGLPEMWPRNRLSAIANLTFQVVSYPCSLEFVAAESGEIREMRLQGRELLSGQLNQVYARRDDARA